MKWIPQSIPSSFSVLWKDLFIKLESSWNVMAHGEAREGKWGGNWRLECVASTLHTPSEHGVSSITTSDAQASTASSRLNWRLRRFKWTRPLRRKTKSGFCPCAITFQTRSTAISTHVTITSAQHVYAFLTLVARPYGINNNKKIVFIPTNNAQSIYFY
jgi:hypothetical protein